MKSTRYCYRLIELAVLLGLSLVAIAADAPPPVQPRAAVVTPLAAYFADTSDLGPVSTSIEAIMKPLASDNGRVWAGLTASKSPVDAELVVMIVDAEHMRRLGCRNITSLECRVAKSVMSNCIAVDKRTIVCDVQFILAVFSLATHSADEAKFAGVQGEKDRRSARFDEFFADNWKPDLSSQLARAQVLTRRLDTAGTTYRSNFDFYLTAALGLALLHEYGHIHLNHLGSDGIGSSQGGGATDEVRADEFALERISRKFPSKVLELSPIVLQDLEEYWFHVAAVSAGFKDGRLTNLLPTDEQKAAFASALLQAGLCDKSHPSTSARILAISRSKSFAPVLSKWPAGYFERASMTVDKIASACRWFGRANETMSGSEQMPLDGVVLVAPGAVPRTKLRYRLNAGSEQEFDVNFQVHINRYSNGLKIPSSDESTKTAIAIRVLKTEKSNFLVGVQPLGSNIASLQKLVCMLTSFDFSGRALTEGIVETKESPQDKWTEDESVANYFRGFPELHARVIVLPDEAIGIGGSWSIRSSGVEGISETRWTLINREGNRLTLKGTLNNKPDQDQKNVERVEVSGTMTAIVDLTQPSPQYTSSLEQTTTYTRDGETLRETRSSTLQMLPLRK